MITEKPLSQEKTTQNRLIPAFLRLYLTLAVPVLLTLASVRIVMNPAFLYFEYTRPDFPVDTYGLSAEDRLHYAPFAIDYLLNSEDISYLENLTFDNGLPLYNSRELSHMVDVKSTMQAAFWTGIFLGIGALAAAYLLWRNSETRSYLRWGLFNGGLLTIGLIIAIVILAVFAWDFFFTNFHNLFFAEGTWIFLYSDTLIRLFPEQFWFDAALFIGGLTTFGALVIMVIMGRWRAA